jgi:hypothetical protein
MTVDDFISSFTDTMNVTHQIIKTSTLDRKGSIYIYFVGYTRYDTYSFQNKIDTINTYNWVIANSLITYDTNTFFRVPIDTLGFDNNGDEGTEIEAAFFANCDKDKEQELLIMFSSFYLRHGMAGNIYSTYAYNFPTQVGMVWKKDEVISSMFDDSNIDSIDNDDDSTKKLSETKPKVEQHKVKYNLARNVKMRLKELGY